MNKITILEETKAINIGNNEEFKELRLGSSLIPKEEKQFTNLLKEI